MGYQDDKRAQQQSSAPASTSHHSISPCKRTLTMGLSPRPGKPLASVQAPVQRSADSTASQRRESVEFMKQWMPTAMRPDLHPAPVQRRGATQERDGASSSLASSGGQPMPENVQAKMEGAMGADFSAVRVHEGPQAGSLGALAFTQGHDIHFAPGQYQPHSQRGQELLGHELAHVVQQSQGRVNATTQARGAAVNDDAGLEREADEIGAKAARGERTSETTWPGGESSGVPAGLQLARTPGSPPSGSMTDASGDVVQRVKINGQDVSNDYISEYNDSSEYNDLLDALDGENEIDHFITAIEHNIITEIKGSGTEEWLASILAQLEGRDEELDKLRQEDLARQRQENERKHQTREESTQSPEQRSSSMPAKDDPLLVGQVGVITKIITRVHKYVIFCECGVLALARPGSEKSLATEFEALKILNDEGCSSVALRSAKIEEFSYGNELKCPGYLMEDASGLHSKQDDNSFKRKLFDMDEAEKTVARECLENILDFLGKFAIGDLQMMLREDGRVLVLDPLSVTKSRSEFNIAVINDYLERLTNESKRPSDTAPDKGSKAD